MFSKISKSLGGSHEQQQSEDEDQSLTTILPTSEDRAELTLLIANCTETMRKGIEATFNAKVFSIQNGGPREAGVDDRRGQGGTRRWTTRASSTAMLVRAKEGALR